MRKAAAVILILVLSIFCSACSSLGYFRDGQIIFKGSAIELSVQLFGGETKKAYEEMVETLTALDNEISLTNETSKLYYFNETAIIDEPVFLSETAYKIIKKAMEFETQTNKAFSIGAYNLTKLWRLDAKAVAQYNKLDGIPLDFTLPTIKEVKAALKNCDTSALKLSEDLQNGKYYISKSNKEFKIDLGAIAKGYCADLCYFIMQKHNIESGVVDISGNLSILGKHFDGAKYTDWHKGITNPRPRFALLGRNSVCALSIKGDVSLVTSGDYERYYVHSSGITPCHIVDPRTGYPVGIIPKDESDESSNEYKMAAESVSSSTIICSSSAMADAYSTAAFVMGIDDAIKFIKSKTDIAAVIFTEKYSSDFFDGIRGRMAAVGELSFYDTGTYNLYKNYENINK